MPRVPVQHAFPPHSAGFSLIELIIVIVLLGILAVVGMDLLIQPFLANEAVERRVGLADAADQALSRMSRDLRLALPNSMRVSADGRAVELMLATSGGRYRAQPAGDGSGDALDFTTADGGFDVLGGLLTAPQAGDWVVIYNLSAAGTQGNAYFGDNRATVDGASTANHLVLNPAIRFPFASPNQRVYLVEDVVTYLCTDDGDLERHWGYAPTQAMAVPPVGGSSALVVDRVSVCGFTYNPGASTRHGLVTMNLALAEAGESVALLKQVQVPNVP